MGSRVENGEQSLIKKQEDARTCARARRSLTNDVQKSLRSMVCLGSMERSKIQALAVQRKIIAQNTLFLTNNFTKSQERGNLAIAFICASLLAFSG